MRAPSGGDADAEEGDLLIGGVAELVEDLGGVLADVRCWGDGPGVIETEGCAGEGVGTDAGLVDFDVGAAGDGLAIEEGFADVEQWGDHDAGLLEVSEDFVAGAGFEVGGQVLHEVVVVKRLLGGVGEAGGLGEFGVADAGAEAWEERWVGGEDVDEAVLAGELAGGVDDADGPALRGVSTPVKLQGMNQLSTLDARASTPPTSMVRRR